MLKRIRISEPDAGALPPITEQPAVAAALADLQPLLDRFAKAQRREAAALAEIRRRRDGAALVDRVKELLGGAQFSAIDAGAELAAARAEQGHLQAAIFKQRDVVDAAKSEASYEATLRFKARVESDMGAALDALRALHAAFADIYSLQAELRAAGYAFSECACPTYQPQATYALGDPDRHSTGQGSYFKAWLIERGIIPRSA